MKLHHYGGFTTSDPFIEWDGLSDQELETFLNTEGAPATVVRSTDGSGAVVLRPASGGSDLPIQVGDWIAANTLTSEPMILSKEGKWKADRYGQPLNINDLQAP